MSSGSLHRARSLAKNSLMRLFSIHLPDGSPDVFIFSTPRSGSTWLMEMIMTQPGFKYCDEPFNLRNDAVCRQLGLSEWKVVLDQSSLPVMQKYLQSFIDGHVCHAKLKHALPFYRHYRPITHRIVFKILHACEDRLDWLQKTFRARIVYLLRHPIPVTLSRRQFPRLDAFIQSDFSRHFTREQLNLTNDIIQKGSKLELGVLIWCLQNAVPLKTIKPEWTVVTYEQLVTDPKPVIAFMAKKLSLPAPQKMRAALPIPSETTWQSDDMTRQMFKQANTNRNMYFIDKWRQKVSPEEEKSVMAMLPLFGLDIYQAGNFMPDFKYIIS
jgi:hypothetical protein